MAQPRLRCPALCLAPPALRRARAFSRDKREPNPQPVRGIQHQVTCLVTALETAERRGGTYKVWNPRCDPEDELTDRWPENTRTQRVFIDELRAFAIDLERLQRGVPLSEMRKTLDRLFGERPAQEAVRKFMDRHVVDNDANRAVHIISTGSVPALGSLAAPAYARPTPKSTPFGD